MYLLNVKFWLSNISQHSDDNNEGVKWLIFWVVPIGKIASRLPSVHLLMWPKSLLFLYCQIDRRFDFFTDFFLQQNYAHSFFTPRRHPIYCRTNSSIVGHEACEKDIAAVSCIPGVTHTSINLKSETNFYSTTTTTTTTTTVSNLNEKTASEYTQHLIRMFW
jgi:hypothetical protein